MKPNSVEDLKAVITEFGYIKENAEMIAKHCNSAIGLMHRIIQREEDG